MRDLGMLDQAAHLVAREAPAAEFSRASRAGGAMARMMALRPALVASIPAETIVCRCEGVTRAEIEAAVDDGATEMNQVKQFTRCGMGREGTRMQRHDGYGDINKRHNDCNTQHNELEHGTALVLSNYSTH
jgi:hypothetical protein